MRISLVLFLLLPLIYSYNVPPTGVTRSSVAELDGMITQCLLTLCKEWIAECHWFCDQTKESSDYKRCESCLTWRGQECRECFNMRSLSRDNHLSMEQVNHRTLVSSDMDVDRIVKESKRTTIVENKEIIYFKRPNRRSQSTPRCTEVSGKDNESERTILSIRDSRRPSNDSLNTEKDKEGAGERLSDRRTSDTGSRSPSSHRVSFHPSTFPTEQF